MPGGGPACELSARKLDDEGGRARKPVVLPVGRGPVQPAHGAVRLASEPSVAARAPDARAPGADDRLRLVVPDGHVRADVAHQAPRQAGLLLGPRARAGVLQVPATSARRPLRGEVAVEVDPASVLPDAEASPVRIEVVDDPEVDPVGERATGEPLRDLGPLALVP